MARSDQTLMFSATIPVDPSAPRIVLLTGLPGSGKTALANMLVASRYVNGFTLPAHLNADNIRATINKHLGFTKADRLKQAFTMGCLTRLYAVTGNPVVVEFVCPDFDTREAYLQALGPDQVHNVFWTEVVREDNAVRYEDTSRMYTPVLADNFDLLSFPRSNFLRLEIPPEEIERVTFRRLASSIKWVKQ